MDITHITSLLGSIALFLYVISITGYRPGKAGGRQDAGACCKSGLLHHQGVIFGTLITDMIRSSAGTVVICVGLVSSGIMT